MQGYIVDQLKDFKFRPVLINVLPKTIVLKENYIQLKLCYHVMP